MRCALGTEKVALIGLQMGRPVHHASVRGGGDHYWAAVAFRDGNIGWVNYRTGEFETEARFFARPWWGTGPAPKGCKYLPRPEVYPAENILDIKDELPEPARSEVNSWLERQRAESESIAGELLTRMRNRGGR
jgi:hypothetical protein